MASKPRDRVGHGKACMRCKRQRTKCSDRSKLTGKCQHCERLGYECEDQFQGGESGESGSTPVEESPSLAYTASPYGTISGEPSNQNLAPPRRIPDALRKIPDFGMAVTDEEHDQALDRGLEWVVRELGRSFNEDAFWAAAMVEVDYPSVRVLHWSLILKGFLIQGDLSVEVAGELSLFVWLALFKDFQSNAAWAYHARVILWDHLSTVGDNRSGLVGAIMSVAPTVSANESGDREARSFGFPQPPTGNTSSSLHLSGYPAGSQIGFGGDTSQAMCSDLSPLPVNMLYSNDLAPLVTTNATYPASYYADANIQGTNMQEP